MCGNRFLVASAAFTFLLASGLFIRIDPVLAQEADERLAGAEIEEIVVVVAPIERQLGTRPATGYRTETIELKRSVSFADLDLSNDEDVLELQHRIENTAQVSCKTLEEMFPLGQKDTADVQRCIKKAIKGTQEEFDSVVAAAH